MGVGKTGSGEKRYILEVMMITMPDETTIPNMSSGTARAQTTLFNPKMVLITPNVNATPMAKRIARGTPSSMGPMVRHKMPTTATAENAIRKSARNHERLDRKSVV